MMRDETAGHQNSLARQAARRTQEVSQVFEFSQEIVRQLEIDQLLQSVADRSRELMHGQAASLCLMDADGSNLKLVASNGAMGNGAMEAFLGLQQSTRRGIALTVIGEQRTLATTGRCSQCRFMLQFDDAPCIAAPLQVGDRVLGALCVVRPEREFDADESRAFSLMANAAAIALENCRLIELGKQQARENAALAERERLAAELHDNLAQTLGALLLSANRLDGELGESLSAPAAARLAELQAGLKRAFAQVRVALIGLRDPGPDSGELIAGLRALLADFEQRTGICAGLTLDETPDEALGEALGEGLIEGAGFQLPAVAQQQLLRIVGEALNNICRHAQATQVRVMLTGEERSVRLVIADNGVGFDPAAVDGEKHLGLAIMHIRAERSGGRLAVQSQPGRGARISVVWPTDTGERAGYPLQLA